MCPPRGGFSIGSSGLLEGSIVAVGRTLGRTGRVQCGVFGIGRGRAGMPQRRPPKMGLSLTALPGIASPSVVAVAGEACRGDQEENAG